MKDLSYHQSISSGTLGDEFKSLLNDGDETMLNGHSGFSLIIGLKALQWPLQSIIVSQLF